MGSRPVLPEKLSTATPKRADAASSVGPEPSALPFRYHAYPPGSPAPLLPQTSAPPFSQPAASAQTRVTRKPAVSGQTVSDRGGAVRRPWRAEATWAAVTAFVASMVVLVAFLLRPAVTVSPQQPLHPLPPAKTREGGNEGGNLSETYARFGYALSAFPGAKAEQVLNTAARYRSEGQAGCPILCGEMAGHLSNSAGNQTPGS